MKICIFGADGRTGKEVVREALSQGHEVRAFVYREVPKSFFPEKVEVVVGDILDFTAVQPSLTGCTAVISVIGHIPHSDPRMQTKGMENISRAMQEAGIERVISLTGTGVRIKNDTPSFMDRVLNLIVRVLDKERIQDGIEHAKVLQASGLKWTILRVLKLTDTTFTGEYRLTENGPAEITTPRKKVAKILVDLVSEDTFSQKMPVVSKSL